MVAHHHPRHCRAWPLTAFHGSSWAPTQVDSHGHYVGYVESRLRWLVEQLEGTCPHLSTLYPYPRSLEWERVEPVLRAAQTAIRALDDTASDATVLATAKEIAEAAKAGFAASMTDTHDEDDAEGKEGQDDTAAVGQAGLAEGFAPASPPMQAAPPASASGGAPGLTAADPGTAAVSSLARAAAAAAAADAAAVTGWQPALPVLADIGSPVEGLADVEDDPLVILDGDASVVLRSAGRAADGADPSSVVGQPGASASREAGGSPRAATSGSATDEADGGWGMDDDGEGGNDGSCPEGKSGSRGGASGAVSPAPAAAPSTASSSSSSAEEAGGGQFADAEPIQRETEDQSDAARTVESAPPQPPAHPASDAMGASSAAPRAASDTPAAASLTASDDLRSAVARGMQPIKTFFIGLRFDRSRVATSREDGSAAARPTGSTALASLRVPQPVLDTWAEKLMEPYNGAPRHNLALAASVVQWEALPARVFAEIAGTVADEPACAAPGDAEAEGAKPATPAAASSTAAALEPLRAKLRSRRSRATRQFAVEDGVKLRARASLTWIAAGSAEAGSALADASVAAARAVVEEGSLPGLDDSSSGRAAVMPIATGGVIQTKGTDSGVVVTATALSVRVSDAGGQGRRFAGGASSGAWVDDGSGLPGLGDDDGDGDGAGDHKTGSTGLSVAGGAEAGTAESPAKRPRDAGDEGTQAVPPPAPQAVASSAAQAVATAGSSVSGFASQRGGLRPAYVSVVDRLTAASGNTPVSAAPATVAPEAKRAKPAAQPFRRRKGGGRGKRSVAI